MNGLCAGLFIRVLCVFVAALGCFGVAGSTRSQAQSTPTNEQNAYAVLHPLQSILEPAGKIARIAYSADCHAGGFATFTFYYDEHEVWPQFPRVDVRPQPSGETGLAAVRALFRNDENVTIQEESGTVRIRLGSVPTTILETKIHRLTFTPEEQYNISDAIGAIENTAEMNTAMRRLGVRLPVQFVDHLVIEPAKGFPHLPVTIRDVTVDQALDLVATTFKGAVLYGVCAQPKLFIIDFFEWRLE